MKYPSLLLTGLLALGACTPKGELAPGAPAVPGPPPGSSPGPSPFPSPSPSPTDNARVYGVTLDNIANLSSIVSSLAQLAKKPTARIVFDENVAASYYLAAATQIHNVAYIMGEILDSYYVKNISLAAYKTRTTQYLDTLGPRVDIWEVGNEINGEWLGTTSDVSAKMAGAYDLVKARGLKTALTLYYNKDCWESVDHEMFAWTAANVPTRMRSGLDYLWVSYYEEDCNGLRPAWTPIFERLATMFPNSKIGFGEVGTKASASKADYIKRYYGLSIPVPSYVGGYFWWYFYQDMVPSTQTLWGVLNTAIR